MSLTLMRVQAPNLGELTIFADSARAAEHLRDHLLSDPEGQAWRLVRPRLAELLPETYRDRRSLAGRLEADGQALYDEYAAAIAQAFADADATWGAARDFEVAVALSLDGVAVIVDGDTVKTAYIPGLGSAEAVAGAPEREAPLPRERSGMRRPRRRSRRREDETDRRHQRREAHLAREAQGQRPSDPEATLYYEVVRPALQFVRDQHLAAFTLYGRRLRADLALLKDVLPPMRQLSFASWRELRRSARTRP